MLMRPNRDSHPPSLIAAFDFHWHLGHNKTRLVAPRIALEPFPALYGSRPSGTRQQRRPARRQISRNPPPPSQWSVVSTDIMGNSPRSRTRQSSGSGKGLLRGARDLDSRRSTRTSLASPAKPLSPPISTLSDPEAAPKSVQHDSPNASEDIAPEIVVWTEDMDTMMVDSPGPATPAAPTTPALEHNTMYVISTCACPFSLVFFLVFLCFYPHTMACFDPRFLLSPLIAGLS